MLCLVQIKGCKRCGGDLSLECDIYGVYAECIQCGATWNKSEMTLRTTQNEGKSQKASTAKTLVIPSQR